MKLDRLLAITMLLLNRNRISAKELAERFEVSLRTIYRDLETLGLAGIPIVSYAGVTGGYEIADSYRLDRQLLSLDELTSLITALKGIRTTQAVDDRSMDSLLEKVGALLSKKEHERLSHTEQPLLIDFSPYQKKDGRREMFAALREAAQSRRVIRIAYAGASGELSERTAEPVGLALKGYVWYLYAYCRLRCDYRTFRLSRIKQLEVLSETYEKREVTLEQLDARWGKRPGRTYVEVVLHFAPYARYKAEDVFEPSEITVEPDGSVTVRVTYPEDDWLIGFVLGLGLGVQLLAPMKLVRAVGEQAKRIAEQYREWLASNLDTPLSAFVRYDEEAQGNP